MDPDATEGCGSVLTRTNSDSSAITLEAAGDVWNRCDVGIQVKSTEWTDEKHSRYLDSLEASFVNELYQSINLGSWRSKKNSWGPYSSRELPLKTINSSDKFTVLHDAVWQKINYERNERPSNSTADSRVMVESSWIRHFKCSGKRRSEACPDFHEHVSCNEKIHHGSARSSELNPVCHKCNQDSIGSTAEVSDQNFVDDNHGGKHSCNSTVKRLKVAPVEASDCDFDQIVPSKKLHATDVSIVNNIPSSKR
ncbi:hypothetical protein UlMin_043369 [Ulmus minor]